MKQVFRSFFCQIIGSVAIAIFLMAPFAFAQDDPQAAPTEQSAVAQSDQAPAEELSSVGETAVESAPEDDEVSAEESDSTGDAQATEDLAFDGDNPDVEISPSDITVTPVPQAKKLQLGGSIIFATVIGIFLVSWLLANYFAKAWRMQDYKGRYFIVFFCFFLALFSTVYGN